MISAFIIGTLLTRWWAKKQNWNDSLSLAIIISLILLAIIGIVLGITAFLFLGLQSTEFLISLCVAFIINSIIGALIFSYLYDLDFVESLRFIIWQQIAVIAFIFIIMGILGGILYYFP